MIRRSVLVAGKVVEVAVHLGEGRIEATVDGRPYVLESAPTEGEGLLWLWNNRVVALTFDNGIATVFGQHIGVEIIDPRKALRQPKTESETGVAQVRTPMPGKIVRILVEEGADVAVGQGLVVMEAMKMQNEIASPKKGKVRKLSVRAGSTANAGDLLAEIE